MLDRIRNLIARHRSLAEVRMLSDRDLSDLGISRDQAINLAAIPPAVPARLLTMAAFFGRPRADLTRDRGTWDQMLTTCQGCGELSACRRLLARADTADVTEAAFCPNAATLAL